MLHRRRANELYWLICPSTTCDHVQYSEDEVTHNKIENKQHCVNNSFPWLMVVLKNTVWLVWFVVGCISYDIAARPTDWLAG